MNIILFLPTLYLSYYTVMFGIKTWKEHNIQAGVPIFIMALSLIGLQIYLQVR